MSFLDELRKQPRATREIMFGLCVVITISLVGVVWFKSFQKNLYVLLNPGQKAEEEKFFADQGPSLLGNISQTFRDLKGSIYGLVNLGEKDDLINESPPANPDKDNIYLLPVVDGK